MNRRRIHVRVSPFGEITVDHLPLFFLGTEAAKALVIGPSGIDDYTKIAL